MSKTSTTKVAVIVPNWNGIDEIADCLDSLRAQSVEHEIIVVENGSTDGSVAFLEEKYPDITLLVQPKNLGFAGGVNVGLQYAIDKGLQYAALFNNDAVADPNWLKNLVTCLEKEPETGIATCTFMSIDKKHLDSTGDIYTSWGLPYPRGRDEPVSAKYDNQTAVFGASGGASLYRTAMLQQIGLFDQDFFAYYEDVDISWRAQLAGWKVRFVPQAIAYHKIGATSGKIHGFTTTQTIKNLPWVFIKNVPGHLIWTIGPRLLLAHTLFYFKAITRGNFLAATKGLIICWALLPKKMIQRYHIQKANRVSNEYINSLITWDLPPNAERLRGLRATFQKLKP